MYGYFAGNIYAAFFSLADDVDSTLGGNVADVYMCAGVFSDDAVTCNSDILTDCRYARYADTCGNSAFMHVAFGIQLRINCMAQQRFVKSSYIFGSKHHQAGALYIVAVIREAHSAFFCHVAHLCQLFALFALADCADNFNVSVAFLASAFFDTAYYDRGIDNRLGIRHAGNGGYTAGSSSLGTADNIFLSFQAGLTHMSVYVNQTGSYYEAGCIKNLVSCFGNILAQSFNFAILNEDIHYSI